MNATRNENGEELGMLVGYAFRWDEDRLVWVAEEDGCARIFDESCTLEYAERYIETHRARAMAISAHDELKARKDGVEPEVQQWRGIYQWLPHSTAVRLADVKWKEIQGNDGMQMIPLNIRKLLGG